MTLNNPEIIKYLIEIFELKNKSELAEYLGIGRQNINSYLSKENLDINNLIITKLIESIKTTEE